MKSSELRTKFLTFFKERGHTVVPSSSLIPADDPTLLFANAGMNQFKDVFLGKEKRSYTRATSIQKCIRAGGKHDDLENVGFTKRHLTFFEMMGNFSFGDYFKQEAIRYAWDFVTTVLQLPQEKIYATVYKEDNEAWRIWREEIDMSENHIVRLGAHDNFWQMGDTGPCGPCSELYFDRGVQYSCGKPECAPGCSCERYLEFWNLVFMEFDRQENGSLLPLKQKGVDTGMGLERLCTIMQRVDSVFDIDIFVPLISELERLTGVNYEKASKSQQVAFRVLVDHIRSTSIAIADGAIPSNEGRGYVIRKIIRRAALFSQRLTEKTIFPHLADVLIEVMGPLYPELVQQKNLIKKLLTQEIEKFANNLENGQERLKKYFQETKDTRVITGQQAFKLYDTYGFPLELTLDIAQEHGYMVDVKGFAQEMELQRVASGKKVDTTKKIALPETITTEFTGYQELTTKAIITALILNDALVNEVPADQECWIITDRSPFFVEKGGQVSDHGTLKFDNLETPLKNLQRINGAIAAHIRAPKNLTLGDRVALEVDREFRLNTMKNHTATHLLQGALISILGPQVRQSGSLVTADYLRFDFTYAENLTPAQVTLTERLVNEKIMENIPTRIAETTYKDALDQGVIAIFGEKYNPERVRVVEIPGFSAELCGGTHVNATGDIGCFKITEISALSAGNRRIVAVTGPRAVELFQENFATVKKLAQEFKVKPEEVLEAVNKQGQQLKDAHLTIKELKKKFINAHLPLWKQQVEHINDISYLFLLVDDMNIDELKTIAQHLERSKPGLYFIASNLTTGSVFFAQLSEQLSSKLDLKKFGEFLKTAALRGGGSKTQLQGGGAPITPALGNLMKSWIDQNIAS